MAKKTNLHIRPDLCGGYLLMDGGVIIAKRTTAVEAQALLDGLIMGREVKLQ